MVGVQQASFGWAEPLLCQLEHFPDHAAARSKGADLVAHAQRVTRARGLPIHAHVIRLTRRLSQGARLEQTRGTQEAVEPHRLRQASITSGNRDLTPRPIGLRLLHDHRASLGRWRWRRRRRRRHRLGSRGRRRWRLGAVHDRREAALRHAHDVRRRLGCTRRWLRGFRATLGNAAREVARERCSEQRSCRRGRCHWPFERAHVAHAGAGRRRR